MFIKFCYILNVEFVGLIYLGLIGCLFLKELFDIWNKCEVGLVVIDLEWVLELVILLNGEIVYMG